MRRGDLSYSSVALADRTGAPRKSSTRNVDEVYDGAGDNGRSRLKAEGRQIRAVIGDGRAGALQQMVGRDVGDMCIPEARAVEIARVLESADVVSISIESDAQRSWTEALGAARSVATESREFTDGMGTGLRSARHTDALTRALSTALDRRHCVKGARHDFDGSGETNWVSR